MPEKGQKMTVDDFIRSMSDLEMAQFLEVIISARDQVMSKKLQEQGVPNTLIEMPVLSVAYHLAFLRKPAEDVFDLEARDNG